MSFAAIGGPGVEGTLMTFGSRTAPQEPGSGAAVVKAFEAKRSTEAYTLLQLPAACR